MEYHTNESSLGKIGYVEAVTTNREIVANHLAYTLLYMFLVADESMTPEGFLIGFFILILFIVITTVIVVASTVAATIGGIDDDDFMSTQNE